MRKPRRRRRIQLRRRGIVTIVAICVLTGFLLRHAQATMTDRGHQRVAEQITHALIARDTATLLHLFPPTAAPDIANDVRLGSFADRLQALGTLRTIRFVGSTSAHDTQAYLAFFTHGTLHEELAFRDDKLTGFAMQTVAKASE